MAKVVVTKNLRNNIFKKFKGLSKRILLLMRSLESNHIKGKILGNIGDIVIKEIKYDKFRFYFITDGHILKFGTQEELETLLIKFIRMSEKKDQQKIINEIKNILISFGKDGF